MCRLQGSLLPGGQMVKTPLAPLPGRCRCEDSTLLYLRSSADVQTPPLFFTWESGVTRLHPPFTWESGVQTPPSLYLGVRCEDSKASFTWGSDVKTPTQGLYLGVQVCRLQGLLYLGVRCADSKAPFTWESGVLFKANL